VDKSETTQYRNNCLKLVPFYDILYYLHHFTDHRKTCHRNVLETDVVWADVPGVSLDWICSEHAHLDTNN